MIKDYTMMATAKLTRSATMPAATTTFTKKQDLGMSSEFEHGKTWKIFPVGRRTYKILKFELVLVEILKEYWRPIKIKISNLLGFCDMSFRFC